MVLTRKTQDGHRQISSHTLSSSRNSRKVREPILRPTTRTFKKSFLDFKFNTMKASTRISMQLMRVSLLVTGLLSVVNAHKGKRNLRPNLLEGEIGIARRRTQQERVKKGAGGGQPDVDGTNPPNQDPPPAQGSPPPVQYTPMQIEYLEYCRNSFLSEATLEDGIISQNEFTTEILSFCQHYTTQNVPGYVCPNYDFSTLPVDLQLIFTFNICPEDEGQEQQMECMQSLKSLNMMGAQWGYIVTDETMPKVDEEVEQLCFRLLGHVFDDTLTAPPTDPPVAPTAAPTANEPPTSRPSAEAIVETITSSPTRSPTPAPTESSDTSIDTGSGGDNMGQDQGNQSGGPNPSDLVNPTNPTDVIGGDPEVILERSSIIGLAVAAAACLLCCFIIFGRRRGRGDEAKVLDEEALQGDGSILTEGTPDLRFMQGYNADAMADTGEKTGSVGSAQNGLQFTPSAAAAMGAPAPGGGIPTVAESVEQIIRAVDAANWDEVYNLASALAEREDLSTLSSAGKQQARVSTPPASNRRSRMGLSEEDLQRANTLDKLIDQGDWTGVAVTAALYSGESGSVRETQSPAPPRTSAFSFRNFFGLLSRTPGRSDRAASGAAAGEPSPRDDAKSGTTEVLGVLSFDTSPPHSPPSPHDSPDATQGVARGSTIGSGSYGVRTDEEQGISNSSSELSTPLAPLRSELDRAISFGDWDKVLLLSSQVEKNDEFMLKIASIPIETSVSRAASGSALGTSEDDDRSVESLKDGFDRAVFAGDWALVSYFANRIREKRGNENLDETMGAPTSSALIPATRSPYTLPSGASIESGETERDQRESIAKLAEAGQWKGVSIMAGLYEMENREGGRRSTNSKDFTPSNKIVPASSRSAASDTSRSWMGLLDFSRTAADTSDEESSNTREQPYMSPPPMLQTEEVRLRSVNTPQSSADSHPAVLRGNVDRVDITSPTTALTTSSSGPSYLPSDLSPQQSSDQQLTPTTLIPYWQQRDDDYKKQPPSS